MFDMQTKRMSWKKTVRATMHALGMCALVPVVGTTLSAPYALSQAAPAAATSQRGTVKAIAGNKLTLTTDKGQDSTLTLLEGARILQLSPGSTDLKSAQPIVLTDIAVGDRVLVTGKADETNGFTASRVILMKSTDIAQKNAGEQADWQKRGSGGIVTAVDGSTVTMAAGSKKVQVVVSPSTSFRRYAGDSVRFEDALPGTVDQIKVGDQMRVRGAKSDDGSTITAEAIVSGSFRNLSGPITSVDASSGSLVLKDLATKKTLTLKVTANSELKVLPPEAATRFLARQHGAGPAGAGAAGAGSAAGAPEGAGPEGAGRRSAGMDLSQMLSRLPSEALGAVHPGDVVMVVASSGQGDAMTVVTLLSGVAPLLSATPSGTPAITLSPWNMGAPEGAAGATP